MLLINPGSEVVGGTFEDAKKEAARLLQCIKDDGITDVVLLADYREEEGRFQFTYKHTVTGKTGEWDITGLEHVTRQGGFGIIVHFQM